MSTNVQRVRDLYDAFAKGDVPAVLGALDPDIEWREADNFVIADGNPYVGPQAVAEGVFQRLASMVNSFAAESERFIDGGDVIAVEGRYTGTVAATSKPVDAQFVHVWELRGGKVVRFQQYTDTAQWARVTGA